MLDVASSSEWLGPPFRGPAERIVSLVPSLTHAVFSLGAGDAVVGRTEYCVLPEAEVERAEVVGGTKNPDVDRVFALSPDLILANREENTRRRVENMAERVPVLLTDPGSPSDVPALWRELGAVCGRQPEGDRRAREVEDELGRAPEDGARFVYWIWRDPWMAAGHGTYISELLTAAGWRNALSPERTRYPRVDPAEIEALIPDAMLFSSEPFDFELPRDLDAFAGPADAAGNVWRLANGTAAIEVDGRLLSWYPSLTAAGLNYARGLRGRVP
jgi:ABC-type Fe3+-hydroxamate transport system substrate-binding protein